MITKKDIPLVLLKAIEGIAHSNLDIIKLTRLDNTYYNFTETDENSNNYFRIYIDGSKQIENYNVGKILYQWKPTNADSIGVYTFQGNVQDAANQFKLWITIIREFNSTLSLHDDNFTKQYANYYFDEFKILDDDAETSPFNPKQQNFIEIYLENLQNSIEKSEENIDTELRNELVEEIAEIRDSLQSSTKNQVMKKITKVFGKLFKNSKELAKEIIKEAKKLLIKNLLENGVDYVKSIIEMTP